MTGVSRDIIPFGLSFGNRNYLQGINLVGLRRKKYENKKILELDEAYKKIFSSKNFHENVKKINGEYKTNELVREVTNFISKESNLKPSPDKRQGVAVTPIRLALGK